MAPEVLNHENHSYHADFFAVGVIAFECMYGRRPYYGRSRQEIRDHISTMPIQIKPKEVPHGWNPEAADFINKVR